MDQLNSSLFQEIYNLHAEICSALADPWRIYILYALAEQPLTVSEIAAQAGLNQPSTSRYLKTLRNHGLVRPERQGQSILYHLADRRLITALDLLRDVLRDQLAFRASLLEQEVLSE